MARAHSSWRRSWGRLVTATALVLLMAGGGLWAAVKETPKDAAKDAAKIAKSEAKQTLAKIDGRELFTREWTPGDSRAHGGDGLGPVFNETSCAACHNLGGLGGGGPANANVDIISAFAMPRPSRADSPSERNPVGAALFEMLFGDFEDQGPSSKAEKSESADAKHKRELIKQQRDEIAKIHPGFLSARSVVLHRFGNDEGYEPWRQRMSGERHDGFEFVGAVQDGQAFPTDADVDEVTTVEFTPVAPVVVARQGASDNRTQQAIADLRNAVNRQRHGNNSAQVGNFLFVRSQRNATALYGAGLMDSISDDVLKKAAEAKHEGFPEVQGRVAKQKDGKLGRFGWKGQKATLEEFALVACSVELGLNVPGHAQAGSPQKADYKAPGLDMSKEECEALVKFLRELPAPTRQQPAGKQGEYLSSGEKHFAAAGCATCHTPKLGEVAGIYSDLLLHDMGDDLEDGGAYGVFVPNSEEENDGEPLPALSAGRSGTKAKADDKTIGALRQEWRTPPLWGVRDSAPYLHDGRAQTLDQAIAFHGGQGTKSAQKYFALKPAERAQVLAFLKSLTAPDQLARAK